MGVKKQIAHDDFQGSKFPDLAVLYPEEFQIMYECAKFLTFQADEPVIVEGQEGEYFYLVKTGLLSVVKEHDGAVYEVATITSGDVFGEASVLYKGKAGAEVRAIDRCELYAIPSDKTRELFENNERFLRATTQLAEKRSAASALAVSPIFSTLPMAVREVALFNAKFVTVSAGEELVSEADGDARFMFIILAGSLEVYLRHPSKPKEQIRLDTLGSGDEVGEISVVTGMPHSATVVAASPVRVLATKNTCVTAWAERYSDFAYALYGQVYKKLHANSEVLKETVSEDEAKMLTLSMMPSLDAFKAKHNLYNQ